jgi:hypothetical protein
MIMIGGPAALAAGRRAAERLWNADPMAKDVDRALCEIAAEHGNLDLDAARASIQSLSADKRYHRDVY